MPFEEDECIVKSYFKVFVFYVLAVMLAPSVFASETFIIKSIDFSDPADWNRVFDLERRILSVYLSSFKPFTAVEAKEGGEYYVWSCAPDFSSNPGTRYFSVSVNGKELPKYSGRHGFNGWKWELLGRAHLKKGENIISLSAKTPYARSDALLFTKDENFNPNILADTEQKCKAYLRSNLKLNVVFKSDLDFVDPVFGELAGSDNIEIKNPFLKLVFAKRKDSRGNSFYSCRAEVFDGKKWISMPSFSEELLVLFSSDKDPSISENYYYPAWRNPKHVPTTNLDGVETKIDIMNKNPFSAGSAEILRAVKVVPADGGKAAHITYSDGSKARISLLPDVGIFKFEILKIAPKDAFYSFCIEAFHSSEKSSFSRSLLPPLYQNRRIMDTPKLVSENFTSQPVAMLQSAESGVEIARGLAADPQKLPFGEWSKGSGGRYGLSLANHKNNLQTVLFSPLLGGADSFKKAGERIEASWYGFCICGSWRRAFDILNTRIFTEPSTMREAYDVSFSDAACNIAEYLKNKDASGWSDVYKARTQIEARNTGTQAAPLAEMELSLITGDEDAYWNFSLPTIEFTLSRKFRNFCPDLKGSLYGRTMDISGDYYAALYALTGRKNEFLKSYFTDENGHMQAYPFGYPKWMRDVIPEWSVYFGIYLATPYGALLDKTVRLCDKWLKNISEKRDLAEPNMNSFVNYAMYPYWWVLPDIYEITGNKSYLDAAVEGAYFSASSLWNFPTPPEGDFIIHKDGVVEGIYNYWWRGKERYRLGFLENKAEVDRLFSLGELKERLPHRNLYLADPKKVPARKVSRVGLGIEQPCTYLSRDTNFRNICMPSWSAEMLRAARLSGNIPIIEKFSRHAIIGRYSNFLGYYVLDYTDCMHDENYPYNGPDITTFYYHHAPCHFAQSVDYLIEQITWASGGKIKFPYVRSQGYFWFTDRIYGLPEGGSVFGDTGARVLIDKLCVRSGDPKISVVLARSKNYLWAILLNDSSKTRIADLSFDFSSKNMAGVEKSTSALVLDSGGNIISRRKLYEENFKVKIPAGRIIALKIPAAEDLGRSAAERLPRIEAADAYLKSESVPEGWGIFRAFRIRSPFGKDSLFAFFEDGFLKKGATATIEVISPEKITTSDSDYPFEFSVKQIGPYEDISFRFVIKEGGRAEFKSEIFHFKGSKRIK